jgi:hypothetical protein
MIATLVYIYVSAGIMAIVFAASSGYDPWPAIAVGVTWPIFLFVHLWLGFIEAMKSAWDRS